MEIRDFYEKEHQEKDVEGNIKLKIPQRGKRLYELAGEPEGKKVLDIGPQFGDVTKYFVDSNEVTIVDFNEKVVEYMIEEYGIEGMQADVDGNNLPFETNTLDVVICSEVIEHLFFYEELVKECHRVLKKGGIFVGSTPNAFNIRARIGFLLNIPGNAFNSEHIRFFNKDILESMFSNYFSETELHGFKGILKDLSLSLFAHLFLWRCVK